MSNRELIIMIINMGQKYLYRYISFHICIVTLKLIYFWSSSNKFFLGIYDFPDFLFARIIKQQQELGDYPKSNTSFMIRIK